MNNSLSRSLTMKIFFAAFVFIVLSRCINVPTKPQNSVNKTKVDSIVTFADQTFAKPDVNVYLENSGSMDGYVQGVTNFESAVWSYLSDIKIADFTKSLNLNYINSKIISFPPDVEEFIK